MYTQLSYDINLSHSSRSQDQLGEAGGEQSKPPPTCRLIYDSSHVFNSIILLIQNKEVVHVN